MQTENRYQVFRSEGLYGLNLRTVAIYSKRLEALIIVIKPMKHPSWRRKKPIDAYLDIDGIIEIAKRNEVDAIHPGYGFLSENIHFARRCEEEGIQFIGPTSQHLDMFGDKVKARDEAKKAGIPVIPGSDGPVDSVKEVEKFGEEYGYPFIIKASLGGGGAGMRINQIKEAEQKPMTVQSQKAKAALEMTKYTLRN